MCFIFFNECLHHQLSPLCELCLHKGTSSLSEKRKQRKQKMEESRERLCINDEFSQESSSFSSWASYGKALKDTGQRLWDRITTRSLAYVELNEVRARSGTEMKKSLRWWDLVLFGIGSIIGAGVFVLTGLQAREVTGPSVVLSFAVSGLSAMITVLCYAEFAVEIPVAGGSFAYLRVELGEFTAFIAAGNILVDCVICSAAVARSWTSYFATLINRSPNDLRIYVPSLSSEYGHLDPIAVTVIAAVGFITILSIKGTSRLNNIASVVHILVILFIIVAGLVNANPKNLSPFAPFGFRGIFSASAVLFFAYLGFDSVVTMAEETENPARDVPIGLIGAMSIVTVIYCLLALTLCLMQPYYQLDPDAAFSVAFEAVGMGWAKYIVAFGALEGMTTSLLVSAVAQARYLTHIARTRMVPQWLAHVNPKTGTPVNATAVMLTATAIIAFFTGLDVLSNFLSISALIILMLVAVAILVRRYYVSGETLRAERNKLVAFLVLILGSSIANMANWAASRKGLAMNLATVSVWFLSTMGLWVFVPHARLPKEWGVPMVPWLPSVSIAINLFLLGSIDGESFVRFGVWTVGLLVYYCLWGVHASYDMAKRSSSVKAALKVEEGSSVYQAIGGLGLQE